MLGDRQLREILEARILSGEWSRRTGGRFNYPSEYRVAYLAQDPVTAQAEAEQIQAPYVHLPVRGTLERVLDLTRHDLLETLETSAEELGQEWRLLNFRGIEAPSQRLGHAAHLSRRVEAISYHSLVLPAGVCLAVFPDRLTGRSFLEIEDPAGILLERIP